MSSFFFEAFKEHVDTLEAAIEKRQNKKPKEPHSCGSPLYEAVRSNAPASVVNALAANPIDLDKQNGKLGKTPLQKAIEKGDVEKVAVLLATGAQIDAKDANGNTALHYATRSERFAILSRILRRARERFTEATDFCAFLDVRRTSDGATALAMAASVSENSAAIVMLLRAGANPEIGLSVSDVPPVVIAARGLEHDNLVALLANGANSNPRSAGCPCYADDCKNRAGNMLHWACDEGIAAILLVYGTDRHIGDKDGNSPSERARKEGRKDIATLIEAFQLDYRVPLTIYVPPKEQPQP